MTHRDDERARGRALRKEVPRSAHAAFEAPERDPVAILEDQHRTRLQGLVPVRVGRMLQSPFAYYRGSAAAMAADLATTPATGIDVVVCGDAHISNFGLYASPERRLVFDLNDFDEATVGPWEWDVKRLAASVLIGGRDVGLTDAQAADATERAVRQYRVALHELCRHTTLERYFFQVDTDWVEANSVDDTKTVIRRTARKATRRTSDQVLERITTTDADGRPGIVDQPPVMVHVDHASADELGAVYDAYRRTLRADTAVLLSQFELVDYVLRVVGVGSVGTRCYVLLFQGPGGEPLFLQAKEAPPSVLTTYGGLPARLPAGVGPVEAGHEGYRVVSAQRVLQAQSDPFLGWIGGFAGEAADRRPVDFYWRQFRDMKGSVELDRLSPAQFATYSTLCGGLLARAHSQSPGADAIDGYLGSSDAFERAVTAFAHAYADQVARDVAAVAKAAREGRLPVADG